VSEGQERGTVKWFNPKRGYGFISRAGDDDLYVHISEVQKAGLARLSAGDQVRFAVQPDRRGFKAVDLALLETPAKKSSARRQRKRERKPSRPKPDTRTDFEFGPAYLGGGYFEPEGERLVLRPEVVDAWAVGVAKLLGNEGVQVAQLRHCFYQVRGIAARLERVQSFAAIKADIAQLKAQVAYQVGPEGGDLPEAFRLFIERNVDLAVENEANFKAGFVKHLESVLGYFVYYHSGSPD